MAFKTIKGNGGILKPESLTEPLVGYLRKRNQGTYSPIYVIEDLQGKTHQVRGCKDLDDKLLNVPDDSLVEIVYVKSVPTKFGHDKVIMQVGIDDGESEGNNLEDGTCYGEFIKDIQHIPYSR